MMNSWQTLVGEPPVPRSCESAGPDHARSERDGVPRPRDRGPLHRLRRADACEARQEPEWREELWEGLPKGVVIEVYDLRAGEPRVTFNGTTFDCDSITVR